MPDSDTAGSKTRSRGLTAGLRRAVSSVRTNLILLVIVFVAVPAVLYRQFEQSDADRQTVLLDAVRDRGLIVARAVRPLLEGADRIPVAQLDNELSRFESETVSLRLLFRPSRGDSGFFYVASAPRVDAESLTAERQRLVEQGVLERLGETCSGDVPLSIPFDRVNAPRELVTSITPVRTTNGCWALVVSNRLAGLRELGRPYWQSAEIQVAGAIYLALAAIVFGLFLGVWRNLARFAAAARAIGNGGPDGEAGFSDRNNIPELAPVAEAFDRMVVKLRSAADNIRLAAEDNAHAFKTPLATIAHALEPLRRRIAPDDERLQQALHSISGSVERLGQLVQAARRLDVATADLLDPPREQVDLSALCDDLIDRYEQNLPASGARVSGRIADGVAVRGGLDMLTVAIENVIDNAISFAPPATDVDVTLVVNNGWAILTVADQGPGVAPDNLDRIFERYFSQRPEQRGLPGTNFGVGLWIVRRNIEALRGRASARNRRGGGLEVVLELPVARTV